MIGLLPPFPTAPAAPGTQGGQGDAGQADFSKWLVPGEPGAADATVIAPAAPGTPPSLVTPVVPLGPMATVVPVTPGLPEIAVVAGPPGPPALPPLVPSLDLATPPPTSPVELRLELPVDLPVPASDDGGLRLAWALSSPGADGVVNLVATLWQLTAGDRLSQQLQLSPAREPASLASAVAVVAPRAGTASPLAPAIGPAPARPLPQQAIAPDLLAFASAAQRVAMAAASRGDDAGTGSALLGANFEWPLKLLRWLNEGPQGATAWLRDFTLAPGSVPALVDELRQFAAAENIPLNRIVLNGHTLWTADPATPHTR